MAILAKQSRHINIITTIKRVLTENAFYHYSFIVKIRIITSCVETFHS